MAKSGQAHNWQAQPIGRPKTVTSDYIDRLKQLVSASPRELGYPFSRWTGQWLSKHLSQEFNIEISARHINRLIGEIEAEAGLAAVKQQHSSYRSHHLVIADLPVRQMSLALAKPLVREASSQNETLRERREEKPL